MKKRIAVVIACALAIGATAAGTTVLLAEASAKTDTIMNETDNRNIAGSEKKFNVQPEFDASAHIKGRYYQLIDEKEKNNIKEVRNEVFAKEGFDINELYENKSESMDDNAQHEYLSRHAVVSKYVGEYESHMLQELFIRFANDGYGDPDLIWEEEKAVEIRENDINRFCNVLTMCLNAYNDPEYEISDTDRVRLIDYFDYADSCIAEYKKSHPDEDLDKSDLTSLYIEKTVAIERC